jgi:large subunit ribosomal protein L9
MHEVKIALHPEVAVTVHVNVARSPEEAELQAQGIDVIKQMFEDQAAPLAAEDLQPDAAEPEGEVEAGEAPVAEAETLETVEAADEPEADALAEEGPAAEGEEQA